MAHARLHIICGNCGCNHMFTYRIQTDINDDTDTEYQYVSIVCNNCNTIHDIGDNSVVDNK